MIILVGRLEAARSRRCAKSSRRAESACGLLICWFWSCLCTNTHISLSLSLFFYLSIYLYIHRERERCMCIYIYIYIYMHVLFCCLFDIHDCLLNAVGSYRLPAVADATGSPHFARRYLSSATCLEYGLICSTCCLPCRGSPSFLRHYSPLLKKSSVRQVVLDKWFLLIRGAETRAYLSLSLYIYIYIYILCVYIHMYTYIHIEVPLVLI